MTGSWQAKSFANDEARFAERRNLFSQYLPYAVVFGATEKWARAFAHLDEELPETSRLIAAFQLLAAMAPRDAASAFDAIGKARHVSPTVRTGLAVAASGSDGGRSWFAAVAVQEGLLPPSGESEASKMEFEARVPALPEGVRSRALRWLERNASKTREPD